MNVQYHRLTDAGFAYAVRMPERMHAGLPMIIQLHGAGERGGGEDLEKAEIHGLANILTQTREEGLRADRTALPGRVLLGGDASGTEAVRLPHDRSIRLRPDRVTLTGLSMGGYGTWFLAMAAPELFAAIAPLLRRRNAVERRGIDYAGLGVSWCAGRCRTPDGDGRYGQGNTACGRQCKADGFWRLRP